MQQSWVAIGLIFCAVFWVVFFIVLFIGGTNIHWGSEVEDAEAYDSASAETASYALQPVD